MKKINYVLLSTLLATLLVGCNTTGNSTKNSNVSTGNSTSTTISSTTTSTTSSTTSSMSSSSSTSNITSSTTSSSTSNSTSTTQSSTSSIDVVTYALNVVNPTKVEYKVGEKLDTTGLEVALVETTNGSESNRVTLNSDDYKLTIGGVEVDENYQFNKSGNVTLVVTYLDNEDITSNIELSVTSVITKRLSVITTGVKIEYEYGETFDATGLQVYLYVNENGVDHLPTVVDDYNLTINGVDATNYVFEVDSTTTLTVEVSVDDKDVASASFEVTAKEKVQEDVDDTNYLGEYTIFNISTKEQSKLVVTDGAISYGTYTLSYTVSESGKFKVNSLYNTDYTFSFSNGVILFTQSVSYSSPNRFVGMKGENVKLNTLLSDGTYESLFEIQNDNTVKMAVVNYNSIFTSGNDMLFILNGETLNESTNLTLRGTNDAGNDGPLSISYGYNAVERAEVDGVMYQFAYYSINIADGTFTKVDVGEERGKFTGDAGDLVLDGLYGEATLNGVSTTYTYDKNSDVATVIVDGKEVAYKLDLTNKTYAEYVVINSDPWSVSTTYVASGKFELTFDNGTVTINELDDVFWTIKSTSYSVSNGVVTFTLEASDWYGWSYDVKFEFTIDSDLSYLTLNKNVLAGDPYDYSTTEYSKGLKVYKA